MSIFTSVEFYTIMAVLAASIVALAARPKERGAVTEHLAGSRLLTAAEASSAGAFDDVPPEAPADGGALTFRCLDNGHVEMVRTGLDGITVSGAVSIAVSRKGSDLDIQERLTPGNPYDMMAAAAVFDLDFLPSGRYHIRYNSDKSGLFAAFGVHMRPGIVTTRLLSR